VLEEIEIPEFTNEKYRDDKFEDRPGKRDYKND